jgi:hypothetical protein
MAMDSILTLIDEEIARLQQVRKLLSGASNITLPAGSVRGRRAAAAKPVKSKRVLSPEARKRIADAQKRRWAAQRKAKKEA